jgi:hypothetical protein
VPADRHLTQSEPVETEAARLRRFGLARSRPTFVVDGLSAYNPRLAIANYPELRPWFANYHEVARTSQTVIYRRGEKGKGDRRIFASKIRFEQLRPMP